VARDLDAFLPTIVDLPDGSFELPPNPRSVRQLKVILGASAVFNVTLAAAWLAWATLWMPRIPWPLRLLPLAFILPFELFVWYVLRPPVLKADAMEVSCTELLTRRRMPRSDLALIYRGQFKERGRKAVWVKYYLFVARDGKIGLKAPAVAFFPQGMAEFAQRLGMHLHGDFTEQVGDAVDLSKTN